MSRALYRKYRSKTLGEIVGQKHVTDILEGSLKQGRIAHAYLLTGPRGVGKTSIARILAHEINHLPYSDDETHLDIIEIDAASNNGVEDVRDLREKVQIAPVSATYKVYIIDEVHMLSKAAFNALLKTLEEPPAHVVFILATTDVDKLPPTIVSRTQQFGFRAITTSDAVVHLRHIADTEKIKIDDEALKLIALRGDGSFRDSISMLDQLTSLADSKTGITAHLVEQSLGLAPANLVTQLIDAYERKDLKTIVTLLDESEQAGTQATVLVSQLIHTVRGLVAEKPQLMTLLDQLLDVAKSSQPAIKLLTVLGTHAVPKPKTAALAAPILEISAPIAELEKQAVKQKPAMPVVESVPEMSSHSNDGLSQPSTAHSGQQRVTTSGAAPAFTDTKGGLKEGANSLAGPASAETYVQGGEQNKAGTAQEPTNISALDWPKLVEYTRQHYIAIHSVLSKCHYEVDGDKLVLYTGNAFYKKKLDDSKHRINLSKALIETGVGNVPIETIGTPPPPKDSTAAAVAAIMGGGEEVSVGE